VIYTEGKRIDILGYPVKVVSTVGAGDCFNAAFIMQLPNGSVEDAARYAVAASALRVSENHQPSHDEILAFMKKD
jgi:ribokinase